MTGTFVAWVLAISALAGVLGAVWYIGRLMGQGDRQADQFKAENAALREKVEHGIIAKDVRARTDLPDDKLHFRD